MARPGPGQSALMAEVSVTVVPLRIEGSRMWIEPFECPCCGKQLIIDRLKREGTVEGTSSERFTVEVLAE